MIVIIIDQYLIEYKRFRDLFIKEKINLTLLKHQLWNHKISLMEEKESTFKSIYKLLKNELKVFGTYLNKYIKKEFIRFLISLTKYPILFISKSEEELWMYINYQQLNEIMIKNRYALSLILEL